MKALSVIQHTSAEYLGLMEDHLEGRGTRFQYYRPFATKGKLPTPDSFGDGLVLLSGGPFGCAGTNNLPSLADEVQLVRQALSADVPIVGIGLGAQIICLAAGSQASQAPLTMSVDSATRTDPRALGGFIPENFPVATYRRDQVPLPDDAVVLATLPGDEAAVWQLGDKVFGFAGHPGFKSGMVEDLVMEYEEAPTNVAAGLQQLRDSQDAIADALVPLMTGLVAACDWMD